MKLAAVEGGGTTWVVAIMEDSPENIIEMEVFETTTPSETLGKIRSWLQQKKFDAIGVATFGPVDANPNSATYGYITSTPKPNWENTDVLGLLGTRSDFGSIPCKFDTDVNAPALAEFLKVTSSGSTIGSSAYITVGTGIGVGLVVNGKPVHGLLHPEGGHVPVKRHPEESSSFRGTCPFHGDCVEGMCSTGALTARKNCTSQDLPSIRDDDVLWDLCAFYIAQLCMTLVLIASPELIIIGGGVLNRTSLYDRIRTHTLSLLAGYIRSDLLQPERISEYIRPSIWCVY